MDSKEYKISKIVDDIGVSKVAVYNKITSLKSVLRNHIKLRKGIKYIDSEGLEIIKSSIGLSKEKFKDLDGDYTEGCKPECISGDNRGVSNVLEDLETSKKYIGSLENQVSYLKSDNAFLKEILDKEIASKNKQLEAKHQLLGNSQVLLGQEQERNKLLLESFREKEKKSFWSIFRKHDLKICQSYLYPHW